MGERSFQQQCRPPVPATGVDSWPLDYKWVVVLTGLLVVFAALGLGRFALGMLLPSMGATLNLSYSQMGFVGTGNFIGYLVAVFLSRYGVARYGSRAVISSAVLVLGLSMTGIAHADGFLPIVLLYCLTGAASGFANVPMIGLVTPWFAPARRGMAAGIMSIGSGLGIMVSGVFIPLINDRIGVEGWRTGWLVFGMSAIVIAGISAVLLRERPRTAGPEPVTGDAGTSMRIGPVAAAVPVGRSRGTVFRLGSVYFLFGFTYAIYATFIVTTMVAERGFSEAAAGSFWFWVGVLSLFSGPLFGALSDRLGRKAGLILVFALHGLAYGLVAVSLSAYTLYLSIGLFGLCAWSIPSIMAAAAGDYMGPRRALATFSTVTVFFSVGQIIGPALAGVLAERSGGFANSYMMAAALAGLAIAIAATLRRPAPDGPSN